MIKVILNKGLHIGAEFYGKGLPHKFSEEIAENLKKKGFVESFEDTKKTKKEKPKQEEKQVEEVIETTETENYN